MRCLLRKRERYLQHFVGIVNLKDKGSAKEVVCRYFPCSGNFRAQAHRLCAQFAMMPEVMSWLRSRGI